MGVTIATTRAACNTSTGNQDITTADLGELTPKGAWFVVSKATSDGVAADHFVLGFGAATATDERWANCASSEHNLAASDCYRWATNDECVLIMANNGLSVDGEADFVSFITNGVRINWGNAPSAAYLLTVVLFAGSDVSAYAGKIDAPSSQNEVDITDPGFEPEILLLAGTDHAMADATSVNAINSLGFVANGDTVMQCSHPRYSLHNQAFTKNHGGIEDSAGYCSVKTNDFQSKATFKDFDSSGFTFDITYGAGDASDDIGYLAVSFGGTVNVWAGVVDSPTTPQEQAYTGPGFTPQAVFLLPTWHDVVDTWQQNDLRGGTTAFGVIDGDDEYCTGAQDEQAAGTINSQSLSDDSAINLPQHDGSAGLVATFVSFDAGDGWTLDFTTTDGTARKICALAIEEVSAAADPLAPLLRRHRERRFQPLLVR